MEEKPQRGTFLKTEGGGFSVREHFRGTVGLFLKKKNYKKELFSSSLSHSILMSAHTFFLMLAVLIWCQVPPPLASSFVTVFNERGTQTRTPNRVP